MYGWAWGGWTGDCSDSDSPHFPKFGHQSMTKSLAVIFFEMGKDG